MPRTRRKGGGNPQSAQELKANVWLPNQEVLEDTPPKSAVKPVKKQTKPSSSKPNTLSTFPARLQWKMAHLAAPATSTPKLDTRTRVITKRDIETAFGFDDTPTEMPANYSALISPIPSEATSQNRLQPVWKVKPLTQKNVECETPPPRIVKGKSVAVSSNDKVGLSEFSQLLCRYNEEAVEDAEPELRVDPKKIVRTYASRRTKRVKFSEERESECEYDFVPCEVALKPEPAKRQRKLKSKKGVRAATKNRKLETDLDVEAKRWMDEKNKEFEDVLKVPLVIEPLSTKTSE